MAVAYGEDEFWERLTSEDTRHKGANAIAIFDMPLEECGAHQRVQITPMLNGTISRGYMVGMFLMKVRECLIIRIRNFKKS